jgi:hypothetical protein
MAMDDSNQRKTPGQSLIDAAVGGYDKGEKKKADNKKSALNIPSMKKGGKVKKTGLHLLHKGEEVIPANKVKRRKDSMRKRTTVKA